MIVHISNPHEGKRLEDIAEEMIGKKAYIQWPFLQEGLVVAISDPLFKYEKAAIIAGTPTKVIKNPHSHQALGFWKMKSDSIENHYSKRCGVITGEIEVLVHVRPLRGLKRMEDGAFVKDYEGQDKEKEQALQMALSEISSEDPRFLERAAPPLSEEFPEGSKVFFLGEHAYGVAAQVSSTSEKTLSVILAFFPSDKSENEKFKEVVKNRVSNRFIPSFRVGDMVGLSGRALSKITSSFMVLTSDNQKVNLGLSLKFEAKALKVIGYSRKENRYWEFTEQAIDLIKEYKAAFPEVFRQLDHGGNDMARATDVFPGSNAEADAKVKEVKAWLSKRGVRDFEPVSLFCDQLDKAAVAEIQKLADSFTENRTPATIKKAIVKGIPRQAVIKPSHAVYRLQNQRFGLGDRVTMVRDSGGVPLSVKGVVIGLNPKSMDVVWDVPFMAGTTLGDRCAPYRGATVEFNSCLNLTEPQYIASTNPQVPTAPNTNSAFKPRFGPHPTIQPANGQQAASGFRAAPTVVRHQGAPVHIMSNPNRGRGGWTNGRGAAPARAPANATNGARPSPPHPSGRGGPAAQQQVNGRGSFPPRGGFNPNFRGRGGFNPNFERGRGGGPPRGAFRGRGRGVPSHV
ncbi:hypothetical protein PUNSTDRAFT_66463 [Punctularia strigosozonata HHB-11173 SS5]|uniref:uncharacterized protein n=1 Tax=Punctularia strigosozonata (strain HHB-11173) TaxID=741275 RepID=UPI0004417553|nr:uncharacterized protein PUNSTDRAFT_66463 [Punctularia strigosozonata HHB-11173 SS5]EIN10031.1 hypothetical protein PUNSTDRAFT_66463 [Punctularia strigosozonata HHB-11173 SS5]